MRYEDLINRLIDRRYTLHLSQNAVADEAGVYQCSIARYERLKTMMQIKNLFGVIQVLQLRLFIAGKECKTGADVYGIVNHTMVAARITQQRMLEELGYSPAAQYSFNAQAFNNKRVDRLLEMLAYLHLDIKLREAEG